MGLQGPYKVECGELLPAGCGVVSAVTPANDFNASTKDNPVQERDKATGVLVWHVDVMDFDLEARDRTFRVKVVAEHQPVPPDAIPGTPVRPVILENLLVRPWLNDRGSDRGKLAYSLRCTGLSPAKINSSGNGVVKAEGRAA